MSVQLPPPPTQMPFDENGRPSKVWIEWSQAVYRSARKYRGSGTTANRPTNTLETADWYLDTTLGKPIWYNGSGWIDATGASV